jgi:hypothetical protein
MARRSRCARRSATGCRSVRSRYVIDRGKVIEARPCSVEEVEAERRRDRAAKERIYGQTPTAGPAIHPVRLSRLQAFGAVSARITGKS